ncbi:gas vesicle protein GvpO [Actinomadura sp. NPDC047616]|uniref:gas vesicle protein GvpO n=1 Tax=Actinomadura sp. NPDC047616 TaxID=3155914 RepID=UPI0033D50FA8
MPRQPPEASPAASQAASQAARRAVGHVTGMTGRDAEGVVGVQRRDDGGWRVTVEVVETHRIPDSADILAVYETDLDADGELVAFHRTRRYPRGRVDRP